MDFSAQDRALLALLEALEARDYDFITPTPATVGRIHARGRPAASLRDVLGWSSEALEAVRSRTWDDLRDPVAR